MSIEAKPITPLGQHEYGGEPFPLVLNVPAKSLGEACEWAGDHAAELDAHAAAHGAVLLRGLPLAKPGDFDAVVSACLLYTSPSPRDVEESRMPSSA